LFHLLLNSSSLHGQSSCSGPERQVGGQLIVCRLVMVTRCSRSPLTDARLNRGGDGHQYPQEFEDASSFELGLDFLNDERVSRRTYVSWRCLVSS
jgi:hypothetical protein